MNCLKVECYAGYRGDQYPRRLFLRDRMLKVVELEDQWYSPSKQYFKILASDGNVYILCHNQDINNWSLTAFRKNKMKAC
jgi:hypothetical protein